VPLYLEYMGYSVEVPTGETVVGRDVRCHLRFNDSAVSRRHIRFDRLNESVYVEDLASTNGTLLNGEPLKARTLMHDGDIVELGGYALQLRHVDDDTDAGATRRIASLSELGAIRRSGPTTPPRSRMGRPTLAPEDRRRHDRRPIELRLVYASSELEIEATTRDLSESGVFVCSHVLDPIGTTCELTLLIDGGPPLQLRGVVRRVVEHEQAGLEPVGLGIEFLEVGNAEKRWLELAIQRMDDTRATRVPEQT
jgi:pSer/pThr/pTyr-binding forkhead associated (FHA) protein